MPRNTNIAATNLTNGIDRSVIVRTRILERRIQLKISTYVLHAKFYKFYFRKEVVGALS